MVTLMDMASPPFGGCSQPPTFLAYRYAAPQDSAPVIAGAAPIPKDGFILHYPTLFVKHFKVPQEQAS